MNDDTNKNKLKMQDMIKELDDLKTYTKELSNNANGEIVDNYIYKLEKDIMKAQVELENIYNKTNK